MAWRVDSDARPVAAPFGEHGNGDDKAVAPQISVVLCTFNRADRVAGAVEAILAQEGADLELVVVDDGSTDATPAVLAAIDDPRVRVVRKANGGLSTARNAGLAAATAPWVVFIDDDDRALPGWLAAYAALGADESVGIACCGSQFVDPDGRELFTASPIPLGPLYDGVVGSTVAGTFAVRTDVARRAGGYLDGLGTRHQTELFVRLLAVAHADGLGVAQVPEPLIRIEARRATERPGVNPRRLYDGTRWIIARYPTRFAGRAEHIARFEGVAGTNAARLGDWRAARRRLRRAVGAAPLAREGWGRLLLATVPALGARVWNRHGAWATHDATEIGVLVQRPGAGPEPPAARPGPTTEGEVPGMHDGAAGAVEPSRRETGRELFLAWRYRENPPLPAAGAPAPALGGAEVEERPRSAATDPVRALAARLARRRGAGAVLELDDGLDIGGVDVDGVDVDGEVGGPGTAAGDEVGLVLCRDQLHRVDDPVALLHRVAVVAGDRPILVSTPDRTVVDADRPLGPPTDPRHRRTWSLDQLELLLLSCGLDVQRWWRVPSQPGAGRIPRLAAATVALPRPGARRDTLVLLASRRDRARPA